MPPGVVLLVTVAAIGAAAWLGYAIVQAVRRNDRTRDVRLHQLQMSFEERFPPSVNASAPLPPPRSPNAKPPEPRRTYDPPPPPLGPRRKPTEWFFDTERREREARDHAATHPELDGDEIMRILDIEPGPIVGRARTHLLRHRLEHGDQGKEAATAELLRWWEGQRGSR